MGCSLELEFEYKEVHSNAVYCTSCHVVSGSPDSEYFSLQLVISLLSVSPLYYSFIIIQCHYLLMYFTKNDDLYLISHV